jgi:hypothetical protein
MQNVSSIIALKLELLHLDRFLQPEVLLYELRGITIVLRVLNIK